jgi:predicted transposase YdaD
MDMPGTWDSKLKLLIDKSPQDFVSWLVEGAMYETEVSPHLKTRNIDADVLYQIRLNKTSCLLHIEFQFHGDSDMAMRIWEYNVLATCQNKLPVYSFIVYLKKTGNYVTPPLVYQDAAEQDIHRFHFGVIKLWEIPTAQLKKLGLKGLLPLLPLTREGKSRAVVENVITELSVNRSQLETDLLSLTYGLASLSFVTEEDHNWLKRRFSMLDDLIKESWAFQEILQRGLEQGLEQGLEKGLEQGLEKGLEKGIKQGREEALIPARHTLIALVERRYPSLMSLAREKAHAVSDMDALQNLILQVSLASHEDEVRTYLE